MVPKAIVGVICAILFQHTASQALFDYTSFSRIHNQVDDSCDTGTEICLPHIQCPEHMKNELPRSCPLFNNRFGVCCEKPGNTSSSQNVTVESNVQKLIRFTKDMLMDAKAGGLLAAAQLRDKALKAHAKFRSYDGTTFGNYHKNRRIVSSEEQRKVDQLSDKAMEIVLATKQLLEKHSSSIDDVQRERVRYHDMPSHCLEVPVCYQKADRYRDSAGYCNNLNYPTWGSRLSAYSRLLPPSYNDGIWEPRRSEVKRLPLPSPRLISSSMFPDINIPDNRRSLMLMQFGQFISHEITFSIDATYGNGSGVSCCDEKHAPVTELDRHYACMPIDMGAEDPFYQSFGNGCMNFVRSVLAPHHDCSFGFAQQMNKVTSFLDGSALYGTDSDALLELREYSGGRLKMFRDYNRDLLPLNKDPESCMTSRQGSACFSAGDSRVNQMITLVAVHTLFAREHNRISEELININPSWTDETIFSEAKRIVVAELQNIVYSEWLPLVVGKYAMYAFDLNIGETYSTDYDPMVDPSVMNEFAAAAFRFGHSTVDGKLPIYNKYRLEEIIDIQEVMLHPGRLRKHEFLDEIISTLTTHPIQQVDNSVTNSLTNYLFRGGNPFGFDLVALNIQRGRDHGLRPYNDYRSLIGLSRIRYFEELGPEISSVLKRVYASVNDVDLYVGGLLEARFEDSMVGPTFREIIAEQFSRLKKGDRYFFTHEKSVNPGFFTPAQLKELRKSSMARIICDNTDRVLLTSQAINAFVLPSDDNILVDCASEHIPRINLQYWKEV